MKRKSATSPVRRPSKIVHTLPEFFLKGKAMPLDYRTMQIVLDEWRIDPSQQHSPIVDALTDKQLLEYTNVLLHDAGMRNDFVLLPHQHDALRWMLKKEGFCPVTRKYPSGGILADEMGLGKTITCIALTLLSVLLDKYNARRDSWEKSTPSCHISLSSGFASRPGEEDTISADTTESPDMRSPEGLFVEASEQSTGPLVRTPPTLIIMPKTLLSNWEQEVQTKTKLFGSRCVTFFGPKRNDQDYTSMENSTFVLTTYDTVVLEYDALSFEDKETISTPLEKRGFLFGTDFARIILDESHTIRNWKNKKCRAVCALRSLRRWCLSGTPFCNKSDDVITLCRFINAAPYNIQSWWKLATSREFVEWRERYLLRRTKDILEMESPVIHNIVVRLAPLSRQVYDKLALDAIVDYELFLESTGKERGQKFQQLLSWILRMRQVCNDPILMCDRAATIVFGRHSHANRGMAKKRCSVCNDDVFLTPINSVPGMDLACGHVLCSECATQKKTCSFCEELLVPPEEEDIQCTLYGVAPKTLYTVRGGYGAKIAAMIEYIHDALSRDAKSKFVIFSQWTSFLDLVENALANEFSQYQYVRLDGETPGKQRPIVIQYFQQRPKVVFFVASLTAGGLGINLTAANHAIIMDLWYHPFAVQQALDRIHRLGQTRTVHMCTITTDTEVERAVATLCERKKEQAEQWLGETDSFDATGLTAKDLHSVFEPLIARKRTLFAHMLDSPDIE